MAQHLDKGFVGEQDAGFYLGAHGYFIVTGPSGSGGHKANAPGFDGVAYNPALDRLIIYDNKAFRAAGNVSSGTAVDPARNLAANLADLIRQVEAMRDLPRRMRILQLLKQTERSITSSGVNAPQEVQIAITNARGNSSGISAGLGGRGLVFIDMNASPITQPPGQNALVSTRRIIAMVGRAPTTLGSSGNARAARVGAAAQGFAALSQSLNDYALNGAIEREVGGSTAEIAECFVRGEGALLIVRIASTSAGVTTSRRLDNITVQGGLSAEAARTAWEQQPRLEQGYAPHVQIERRFIWLERPPTAH